MTWTVRVGLWRAAARLLLFIILKQSQQNQCSATSLHFSLEFRLVLAGNRCAGVKLCLGVLVVLRLNICLHPTGLLASLPLTWLLLLTALLTWTCYHGCVLWYFEWCGMLDTWLGLGWCLLESSYSVPPSVNCMPGLAAECCLSSSPPLLPLYDLAAVLLGRIVPLVSLLGALLACDWLGCYCTVDRACAFTS